MSRVINIPKVGDLFQNSKGCWAEVVKYENHAKVTVQFLDEFRYVAVFPTHRLKNGRFKNLYSPSVFGVGYLGSGDFKTSVGGVFTVEYRAWCSMMARGYSDSYKKIETSYDGCTVPPDWHNFQNFAKWYTSQKFYGMGYQLDKDILYKNNRIYSESTCCLVPTIINSGVKSSKDVNEDKFGASCRANGSYQLKYSEFGERILVGEFPTFLEARERYVELKEAYIKKLAKLYQDKIDVEVYEALMSWKIELKGLENV